MRLIRTSNLEMGGFVGGPGLVRPYAMLSQTWAEEEVTFQDFQTSHGRQLKGFKKIEQLCAQASLNGIEWAWIDTCCIDKTSSADLAEAINSTFSWYQEALTCYVYLEDVVKAEINLNVAESLGRCRWFTRGWTLQELLAPADVQFFDANWESLGTKATLHDHIASITGITHLLNYHEASIAQKMSWASGRETTRLEDQAYCLLGLFDVSMSPRYGEGEKAFLRLQLEIIKRSDDESVFAWVGEKGDSKSHMGLLAPSPRAFRSSGNIRRLAFEPERAPYVMTNKGLCIEIFAIDKRDTHPVFPLHCSDGSDQGYIGVTLTSTGAGYVRMPLLSTLSRAQVESQAHVAERKTVYVRQPFRNSRLMSVSQASSVDFTESIVAPRFRPRPLDFTPYPGSSTLQALPSGGHTDSRLISTLTRPILSRTTTWSAIGTPPKYQRPRGCLLVIASFASFCILSLFLGIYFTMEKKYEYSMGDAFTLASFVLAIGVFVSGAMAAYHYPYCKCWRHLVKNHEVDTELHSLRRND